MLKHSNSKIPVKWNVHKLTVEGAIEEIMYKFEECVEIGFVQRKQIHI